MFSCFVRFLLFVIVCLAIGHAYPSSMRNTKWIPTRVQRPHVAVEEQPYDYLNLGLGNENENDQNDSNGFATWLFRSRKFCCAPPL